MGTLGQMATQLQSMVSDPSMIGPMLTAAASGMATNYVGSKLGKLNPMDKIEQAISSKLDNTRVGRWVNNKIDQASDYMDRKLGNTGNTVTITPEIRAAIGSEVTAQLNSRGVGRSSGGGTASAGSTPPSPNSSNSRPPTPPPPSGAAGGASGSR